LLKTKIDANSVENLRLIFMALIYVFAEKEKKKNTGDATGGEKTG